MNQRPGLEAPSVDDTGIGQHRRGLRAPVRMALAVLAYLVGFLLLDFVTEGIQGTLQVSLWFPPAGLTFAFLLVFGWRFAAAVAPAFLLHLILFRGGAGYPLAALLLLPIVYAAVYAGAAALLLRVTRIDPRLTRMRDVAWFVGVACLLAPALVAAPVVFGFVVGGYSTAETFREDLLGFWAGDATGVAVLAPLLLVAGRHFPSLWAGSPGRMRGTEVVGFRVPSRQELPEALLQVVVLALVLAAAYGVSRGVSLDYAYLTFAPVVWIALRGGFERTVLALLAANVGVVVLAGQTAGGDDPALLQFGLMTLTLVGLILGSQRSEQERTERALRSSERRFRSVVQNSTEVIEICDPDGTLRYASPSHQELFGYAPEKAVGTSVLDRVHPDDLPSVLEETDRATNGAGRAQSVAEYRVRHADGSWRWVESVGTYLVEDPAVGGVVVNVRDVTERKEAEEALRESERRFRSLVQNSSDVITILDADGTVRYGTSSLERNLGYPSEELVGGNVFDYVYPEDMERVRAWFAGLVNRGGMLLDPTGFRFRHADGSWRYLESVGSNLLDDPTVRGVVVTSRDITESKEAEAALEESEERYRAVVELSVEPIYIYDAETKRVLESNEAFREMMGYTGEELLGTEIYEFIAHDREDIDRRISRSLKVKGRHIGERNYRRKDGSLVVVQTSSSVMPYGGRTAICAVSRDVTGLKQTRERLEESERRFRSMIQNAPDAISVLDADSTVRYDSPAIERLLGYAPEERIGRKGIDYVHPEDRETARRTLSEVLDNPGVRLPVEYRLRHKDGSWRYFEAARTNLLGDPAVGGIVLNYRDVTERKRAEEALKKGEEGYRRQARELELLHRVRTALARGMELPTLFRTVVETVARTYGYTQVSGYLLRGETLVLQHQVGYEQVLRRIPVVRGVMGRAIRTRRPVLIGDVRSEPDFLGAIEGLTSEVCVPLFDEGEVMGVLNVESKGGVELAEDDLRLVSALAEHVNVAISRSRLHTRVRESEERFRSLIHNASDVVTLLEVDGTIRYQSPPIERILGYGPEELVERNVFAYIHPDDLDQVRDAFSEMLADPGLRPSVEYRFRHQDGSWRYLESIGSNLLEDPRVGKLVINSRDITERRRWEEKLREAEERYRGLVETIPAITYVGELDEVSTAIYISPQIESILGFTAEERTSTPGLWVERLHPEDRERVLTANDRSNATGDPFDEEYRMIARDGSEVWMHDASVVLRGGEDRPSYRQGVMFDVTERRRTEGALYASEMRMRTVIEQSPLGIHIFAPDGTSLLANGAWDELWYLDAEEAAQHANVFEDELLRSAGLIRHIERSVAEGVATIAPPLLFDPADAGREGVPRWLRALIYPVRGEDGVVLETVLLLEDVTERKRAEDALKESEERYRAVIEQSAEAIWLFDPETKRVLEANAAFQEMLGYGIEELRSMTNYDFVAHSREDVDRAVARKLHGEEILRAERKYRRKDGTLLDVEVGGTAISYGGKMVVCSAARDITERRRAEEDIREANRRLSDLAVLKADFTAMVAHELDTPLAVIRGYADILAAGLGDLEPGVRERALSRIRSETETLDSLVADVRSAASSERSDFDVEPGPMPLGDLLSDAAAFAETLPGEHRLRVVPGEGVGENELVLADRERIGQVLRNLLSNAAKYSPEGAPVELRTSRSHNPGRVRVEVADRGPGIKPDDMRRIFEKFGRGHGAPGQKVGGLGLGLYLSRRIIRAHGGELTVDAEPYGDGSVFGFDLEAADE